MDLIANTPPLFGVIGVTRPDLIVDVPLYLNDPMVAGGRRINSAAFSTSPPGRQGTLGRSSLRGFPFSQLDLALQRRFSLSERTDLQLRADFFNVLNHPNFGAPNNFLGSPLFGQPLQMLGSDLGGGDGGFSPLYQIRGSRSIQLNQTIQDWDTARSDLSQQGQPDTSPAVHCWVTELYRSPSNKIAGLFSSVPAGTKNKHTVPIFCVSI